MQHRPSHQVALVLTLLSALTAAHAQDGILDPTFSTDGRQTAAFENLPNNDDYARSVAVQPDGKIVLAGDACGSSSDCFVAIARFLPDGTPDPGFDTDGQLDLTFGGLSGEHSATEVLVRPQDGKLVVVGEVYDGVSTFRVGLARLTTAGAFVPTFGSATFPGSIAHLLPGGEITSVSAAALTSTGQILVGGAGYQTGSTDLDCFVARFLDTGQLDDQFSGGGVSWIAFDQGQSNHDALEHLAVQADGRIVVLAWISDSGAGDRDTGIARLLSTGTLDASFDGNGGNGDGKVIFELTDSGQDTRDFPQSLAIQPDGKILFAGYNDLMGSGASRWYFGRLLTDGSTDPTLASEIPPIVTPFSLLGGYILVQSDGKLLLSGSSLEGVCLAIRYDAGGDNFDSSFGTAGMQSIRGPSEVDMRCYASALDGGRLVVAGRTAPAVNYDFLVARLTSSLIFSDGFESGSEGQWSSST